jgi:DNA (cytosine-5)-methyltransferase 1
MRTTVAAYYQKQKHEIIEDDKLVIIGEDADDADDGDEKPIREIHGFSIFDPKHRNEMVTLEALEQDDGVDRQFEAAGEVVPSFVDEDVGQEEDADSQYVHLSSILRYTMDYTDENE